LIIKEKIKMAIHQTVRRLLP